MNIVESSAYEPVYPHARVFVMEKSKMLVGEVFTMHEKNNEFCIGFLHYDSDVKVCSYGVVPKEILSTVKEMTESLRKHHIEYLADRMEQFEVAKKALRKAGLSV